MKTFDEVMELTRTVSSNTALEDPEAKALYDCCLQVPFGGLVVEIGCEFGRSSSILAQVAREGSFHTIHVDPYKQNLEILKKWHEMMWLIGGDDDHRYTHICMKSVQATWLLEMLCDDGIDLAFIDGDHEYGGVMEDLQIVGPMVKQGSFLAMHDYGRESLPDVYRAAGEYLKDDEWDQVTIAGTLGVWRKK